MFCNRNILVRASDRQLTGVWLSQATFTKVTGRSAAGSDCFDLYYKFPSLCYDQFELEFFDVF